MPAHPMLAAVPMIASSELVQLLCHVTVARLAPALIKEDVILNY
jgi:hypothetical protein